MTPMLAVSVLAVRSTPSLLQRTLVAASAALALAVTSHTDASAQATPSRSTRWEFVSLNGRVVPTGVQRRDVDDGSLTAAQLSYAVRPALALTTSLGWVESRDLASRSEPRLDRFRFDLGTEFRARRGAADVTRTLRPFATLGVGARHDVPRHGPGAARTAGAAYLGLGSDVSIRRARVRIELRDEISSRRSLGALSAESAHNDVAVLLGVRWGTK